MLAWLVSYTYQNVPMHLITLCNNTWIIHGHSNYFMYHHIEHILSVGDGGSL